VPYLARKMANNISSTVQLVKEGENSYSLNTVSTFRSQSLKFNLNEEFLEETMDGRKIKCLVTFDGNKMIQQQTGERAVRIEREFTENELITKCMIDEVVATRWFKAIE
jgi:fatty acid-binding protein 3, muscle and heart